MNAVLKKTIDEGGQNYYTVTDVANIIGGTEAALENYTFVNSETTSHDGDFSEIDLIQDVDAYNIPRLYDLAKKKLYVAMNDYYYVSMQYRHRFSLFKSILLSEFDADLLYDVAMHFTSPTTEPDQLFHFLFATLFGNADAEYGSVVASAFESKMEALIDAE